MEHREARYKKFMEPLKDLAQNWGIDVAKDLEEYLHELEGLTVSFGANGVSNLNFAEAALLIQGSAVVYSRKVEYLYSLIYHALDVLSAKSAWRGSLVLPLPRLPLPRSRARYASPPIPSLPSLPQALPARRARRARPPRRARTPTPTPCRSGLQRPRQSFCCWTTPA